MAIVEILIGKSKYKIECDASEKDRLIKLAEKLSKRVNTITESLRNTDEKTALVISSLMLEADLEEKSQVNIVEKKAEPKTKNDDVSAVDVNLVLSQNIENITKEIDKLANKIRDY